MESSNIKSSSASSSPSPQSKCMFLIDGACMHPRIHGDTTPEKCASCDEYSGPSRGVGDAIHDIAELTGISSVMRLVSHATGKDCGCGKRRAALNEVLPFSDRTEQE